MGAAEIKIMESPEMQVQKELEASRVAMEEQIVARKKQAFELVERLEENAAKAKHPLSAAEKKQVQEEIEKNSQQYAHELTEEFEETKALQKKTFGHPLSAIEKKHVEQFEAKVQGQMGNVELLVGM